MSGIDENIIVSLDPSSTITGFAVMRRNASLVRAGTIEPERRSDPSYLRIMTMCRDLRQLLDDSMPGAIIIEWTKGKVGRNRHTGQGAGLAVYGAGVGAVAVEAEHWAAAAKTQAGVFPVLENKWTRGVPKKTRQIVVAQDYPAYRKATDPGGDIADAIALGRWWLLQNRLFRG